MSGVSWRLADCRYSGARRCIGGTRRNWGLLEGVGGCFGCVRKASEGVGVVRCVLGLTGTVGTQSPEGYRGIRGLWEAPRGVRGLLGTSGA